MFTARYGLGIYIKHIGSVLKESKEVVRFIFKRLAVLTGKSPSEKPRALYPCQIFTSNTATWNFSKPTRNLLFGHFKLLSMLVQKQATVNTLSRLFPTLSHLPKPSSSCKPTIMGRSPAVLPNTTAIFAGHYIGVLFLFVLTVLIVLQRGVLFA